MTIHWPQVAVFVFIVLDLGIVLGKHGEPKTGKHNFWYAAIGTGLLVWFLIAGGFFGGAS